MSILKIAVTLAKGAVSGLAATAFMTISSTLEMKLNKRQASKTPVKALEKGLGIDVTDPDIENQLSNIVHWTYGIFWGVVRSIIDLTGIKSYKANILHLISVLSTEHTVLPAMDVTAPVNEMSGKSIATDIFHHFIYAITCGIVYERLSGNYT